MPIIISLVCSLFISLSAKEIPNRFEVAKQKLLYEGDITTSKKELLSVFALAKRNSDKKTMSETLGLLGQYAGVSYRDLFKMCSSSGLDCSFYKAKTLEVQGNAGSAMDLYLEGGYYEDYLRLKTYSGEDLNAIAKKYGLGEGTTLYYQGLLHIARGEWQNAVTVLSSNKLDNNAKAKFYLGYALLMIGNNEKVSSLIQKQPTNITYFDGLEYKRLKGLLLYAENKQYEAFDVLKEVLATIPDDFLSKRYLAHIYYRTGWFSKAEKIYSDLINKEWRDTELYYLLYERCEMRIRNLKFDIAKKDAERVIKEYPSRKEFVVDIISLLLSYEDVSDAEHFIESLSAKGTLYEQGLRFFSQGLILEFKMDYVGANAMFKKAMQVFPSPEYNARILLSEQNLKYMTDDNAPKPSCSNYNVKKLSPTEVEVELKRTGAGVVSRYYVSSSPEGIHKVTLPLLLVYDPERISFKDKKKVWADKIKQVWSVDKFELAVDYDNKEGTVKVKVEVVPWPSSFYLKRVSSHEWSVLTPPSVIAHEVGHLLGLEDEYYETDPRILSRNKGRYIGAMSSIMRNMYNGRPEKRHIHFVLSPLKCN